MTKTMKATIGAATVALITTLGALPAYAATPGAAAPPAGDPRDAPRVVERTLYTATIGTAPTFGCPPTHPYVWNGVTTDRAPTGVRLGEREASLTLTSFDRDEYGRVLGWPETADAVGHPTEWGMINPIVTITVSCTDDPGQAFFDHPPATPRLTEPKYLTFPEGQSSFTITATGWPTPSLHIMQGRLLDGLTFTDHGDGTATIAGDSRDATGFSQILVGATNAYGTAVHTINLYG